MKFKKIIAVILTVILIMSSTSIMATADVKSNNQSNKETLYETLLKEKRLKKVPIENATDSVIIDENINTTSVSSVNKSISLFASNNDSVEKLNRVSYVFDNDTVYEAEYTSGAVVGFDENMNMISYSNFNPKHKNNIVTNSLNTDNNGLTISEIKEFYNINSSYMESIDEGDDYTFYCYEKLEESDVINPYNSLKVTIDNTSGNVVAYNRFNDIPDSNEISVDLDFAKKAALNVDENFNQITDWSLEYIKPNFYWNDKNNAYIPADIVRLAYEIIIDNIYVVDVDANTGEIIGGDTYKKNDGGAYSYDKFTHAKQSKNLAATAFVGLGYTSHNWYVGRGAELVKKVNFYLKGNNSYGFYINCHGTAGALSCDKEIIKANQVTGNWHLVFLDACCTRTIDGWAKYFNIVGKKKRAFLGWNGRVGEGDAYKFCNYFWHEMCSHSNSTKNVNDTAAWAIGKVPGNKANIKFYGDKNYNGKAY